MNKKIKFGFSVFALAATLSAFADEAEVAAAADGAEVAAAETAESGAVGWTAVAVSLASPVQLPWGIGEWDVFGLDLGLFYNDIWELGGVQFGLANTTRGELKGVAFGGAFNYANQDVSGVRFALGAALCNKNFYGADFSGFGMKRDVWGWDCGFLGTIQQNLCGLSTGLIFNLTETESYGCALAGGVNLAKTAYGAQVAGVFNQTDELHGMQLGLVNFARECPWGFQIGLVNIIMDNKIKVLPFVNGYF